MSWWTPGIWNFIPYGVLSMADLQYRLHWHQWNKKNRQKEHTVPRMLELARPGLPQLHVLGPDASYLEKPSKLLTSFSRGGTWQLACAWLQTTLHPHSLYAPHGWGMQEETGGPPVGIWGAGALAGARARQVWGLLERAERRTAKSRQTAWPRK